jgi:hypothetical protein
MECNHDRFLFRRLGGQVNAIETTSAGKKQKRKGKLTVRIVGPVPRIIRGFREVTIRSSELRRHPSMLLLIRDGGTLQDAAVVVGR